MQSLKMTKLYLLITSGSFDLLSDLCIPCINVLIFKLIHIIEYSFNLLLTGLELLLGLGVIFLAGRGALGRALRDVGTGAGIIAAGTLLADAANNRDRADEERRQREEEERRRSEAEERQRKEAEERRKKEAENNKQKSNTNESNKKKK
jgi:hypothetical protein